MLRIPAEVQVLFKGNGEVGVFYTPTGKYNLVKSIEAIYPLDIFPSAAHLETGMKTEITVPEEALRETVTEEALKKLQFLHLGLSYSF